MKNHAIVPRLFPGQFAVLLLASAVGIPAWAQQATPAAESQSTPPPAAQQQTYPEAAPYVPPAKEGFWGHVNPGARKVWVRRQTDPINNRLSELDQVNAKNAADIKDVDARAQAGILKAQTAADAASQTASAAGAQAQNANGIAQGASGHVDQLNSTVSGLDKYQPVTDVDVTFRAGSLALSEDAKKQLDDLAAGVTGRNGYILELEAHSPHAGSVGIQNSQRLAESVQRYLLTEHQIPVYRMHYVALGNAEVASAGEEDAKTKRISDVHIRLMENSLAAQGAASPQGVASSTGADRP
jgi:outer membrane protein OmpA-like peptidoglycan-associated protein